MEPSIDTSPKPFAFVLMPLDPAFDDIYKLGIVAACDDAGAYCERVDEQYFDGRILDRIYNQIDKADVIIADMTGSNPNVFYEVGYAHALGKRTIMLTANADDIPFDLKHHPHIIYEEKIVTLKEQLTRRLSWALSHPSEKSEQYSSPIEIYSSDTRLESLDHLIFTIRRHVDHEDMCIGRAKLSIQNVSGSPLSSDDVSIAVQFPTPPFLKHGGIALPTGDQLIYVGLDIDSMFPDQWATTDFPLTLSDNEFFEIEESGGMKDVSITIIAFTQAGRFEYPIRLRLSTDKEYDRGSPY